MAVSIKDIARVAHVSYSTVSRALNDSPRVRAATKARVQHLAAEMGYLPSGIGRSLVTRRTRTLGIVVSTITDLFFAEVIASIEETALEHGYSVILSSSGAEPERELRALRTLRERRVDGIVLVSGCSSKEELCGERGPDVPIVIVNHVHKEHMCHSVEVDNAGGGETATRHLLELGHRRIAHIAGPAVEWDAAERQRGYEQALRAWDLPLDPPLIACAGNRPPDGIEAMQRLLALPDVPTAVFCYNDATALGAMRAARAAGLSVPGDVSIVGFDDIDLAPYLEPPLTTVAQPKREMGATAVRMVLDLLAGSTSVADCVFPSHLVIRASTSAVRHD